MSFTHAELDHIYCMWTGQIHTWVANHLGRSVNVEFVPHEWKMRVWPGPLHVTLGTSVFSVERPKGDGFSLKLLDESDHPTKEDLDNSLRALCNGAAFILGLKTQDKKLLLNREYGKRHRTKKKAGLPVRKYRKIEDGLEQKRSRKSGAPDGRKR